MTSRENRRVVPAGLAVSEMLVEVADTFLFSSSGYYLRKRRTTPVPKPSAANVIIAMAPPPLSVLPLLEPLLPLVEPLLVEPDVPLEDVSPLVEPDVEPLLLGLPMLPLLLDPVLLPDCPDVLPLWSVAEPVVPPVCPLVDPVVDPLCGDVLD
jgi:hypothetical protein